MSETVDARGLSCPQPVLDTLDAIKKQGGGSLEVLVDNDAAVENVSRAVQFQGWEVTGTEEENGDFRLTVAKK